MRSIASRIARLESALGITPAKHSGCLCTNRPVLAVTEVDDDGNPLPSDPAQLALLAFACPRHGAVGPKLHVQIVRFRAPRPTDVAVARAVNGSSAQ